jgi:hypothetical protein
VLGELGVELWVADIFGRAARSVSGDGGGARTVEAAQRSSVLGRQFELTERG